MFFIGVLGMIGMTNSSESELEFIDVSMEYYTRKGLKTVSFKALEHVSFSIRRGESTSLVGASGSGKSTVAKLAIRLLFPTSGKILYKGEDTSHFKSEDLISFRRKVQMVFQDPYYSLDPTRDIGWHVERPLKLLKKSDHEIKYRIKELLEEVELSPPQDFLKKYPGELSGGQRQRAYMARVLALDPEVLIADEPVSMLDISLRAEVLNLMKTLVRNKNISLLYITHDMSTIRYISSKLHVMKDGHVIESGDINQILENPTNEYTKKLISSTPDPFSRIEG
jgi:peptide/nickel transport system ATP-binding protein